MAISSAVPLVSESIKETLLGIEEPQPLSATTKATFLKFARKSEESGELYMGEEEFIDAIAPKDEDYVSGSFHPELP
jgi:solute carrier family 25 aspartate/glutamate transporter 12/13